MKKGRGIPRKIPAVLFTPIEALELGTRTTNVLKKSDIRFVGELCQLDEKKVHAIKGLGKVGLSKIQDELRKLDLSTSMSITGTFPKFPKECTKRKAECAK